MECEPKSCCCGCSVETGTKLLLLFDAIIWGLVLTILVINTIPDYYSSTVDEITYTYYSDNNVNMFLLCAALMVIMCFIGLYGVYQKKPMLIIPYFIYRILNMIFTFIVSILLTYAGILGVEIISDVTSTTVLDMKISYSNQYTDLFKEISIFLIILGILLFWMEIHFVRVVFTHMNNSRKTAPWEGLILESPSLRTSINLNHSNGIQ